MESIIEILEDGSEGRVFNSESEACKVGAVWFVNYNGQKYCCTGDALKILKEKHGLDKQ